MKKIILFLLACGIPHLVISTPTHASQNQLFGRTHMLPSPFTLTAGKLVLGTDCALGITDFFQLGTNVVRDFYKFYNANAKLSILDFPDFAMALTGGFENFNYKDIYPSNPDLTVTSWLPGATTAYSLADQLALFVGGNLIFSKQTLKNSGIQTSGNMRGAQAESDLSWAYNPQKKNIGNVLSTGVSYDFSYKLLGYGVSHHWPGFHVGVHYYPNASRYKFQPILAGGAVVDL